MTRRVLGAIVALVLDPLSAPATEVRFTEVAVAAGIAVENQSGGLSKDYLLQSTGNGVALVDFDGDGDLDVLLANGSNLPALATGGDRMLYAFRNEGGLRFRDVSEAAGVSGLRGWAQGVCVADVDGDRLPDVYVTAYGANRMLRNRGDGSFEDTSEKAGVGHPGWGASCAFGDYDRDGDADLLVANYVTFDLQTVPSRRSDTPCSYLGRVVFCGPLGLTPERDVLYRNRGDGVFDDATEEVLPEMRARYGLGALFGDLQNDGWPDLFVANDSQPNTLFLSLGDGTFTESALLSGVALNQQGNPQAGMGIAVGDYDRDGDLDLFVTNFSQDHNTLYRNHGLGLFSDVTFPANLGGGSMPYLGWGTAFVDLDNDGWLDLFIANGHIYDDVEDFRIGSAYEEPNQIYRGLDGSRFADPQAAGPADADRSSRGAAFGDLDDDGDLDVVVVNINSFPDLLRNDTEGTGNWLNLDLRTATPGTTVLVPRDGSRQSFEVFHGGSYLSHSDSRIHVGLGQAATLEAIEIRWPDGRRLILHAPTAGRFLVVSDELP